MDETKRLDIMLEAVFYESTVDSLVECHRDARLLGLSRELILHNITAMLLQNLDTPGKIASMAAMAAVMLAEERGRK